MIKTCCIGLAVLGLSPLSTGAAAQPVAAAGQTIDSATLAEVDRIFADWRLSAHAPGLVYGIVANGQLIHVRGLGVQDIRSNTPAGPDSLFRIASMSKAFAALAILKLRDEGKVRLDDPAELYVPELKGWGSNFATGQIRNPAIGGAPCRQAVAYGMAWGVADDCDLGRVASHGGGYPGYGSIVMLLPDKGVGIFAFSNRTYGGRLGRRRAGRIRYRRQCRLLSVYST